MSYNSSPPILLEPCPSLFFAETHPSELLYVLIVITEHRERACACLTGFPPEKTRAFFDNQKRRWESNPARPHDGEEDSTEPDAKSDQNTTGHGLCRQRDPTTPPKAAKETVSHGAVPPTANNRAAQQQQPKTEDKDKDKDDQPPLKRSPPKNENWREA